jgi:hypothetical protein
MAAVVLSMSLLAGCARPHIDANWYLWTDPEQKKAPTPESAGSASDPACTQSLYLALLNSSPATVEVTRIDVVGTGQTLTEDLSLETGHLRVVDLDKFACRLPTKVLLHRPEGNPISVEIDTPLPSALPGIESPCCRSSAQ